MQALPAYQDKEVTKYRIYYLFTIRMLLLSDGILKGERGLPGYKGEQGPQGVPGPEVN